MPMKSLYNIHLQAKDWQLVAIPFVNRHSGHLLGPANFAPNFGIFLPSSLALLRPWTRAGFEEGSVLVGASRT